MNCRTFRRRHCAFVDDTVSGFERAQMERHLLECDACAEHDARVRRSLLLIRNLPGIEPSPRFRRRLRARILAARFLPEAQVRGPFLGRRLAAAAVLVLALGLGMRELSADARRVPLALPPVVATVPESRAEPVGSQVFMMPATVASFSTGAALWPAALLMDEAADYFVNTAFTPANLTR